MARTRIYYVTILVMSAVATLALGTPTAFVVLYCTALLPVFSLVTLLFYPMTVGIRQKCPRRSLFKGESQPLVMGVKNKGFFVYPQVALKLRDSLVRYVCEEDDEDGAAPLLTTLPSRGNFHREYTMDFPYRGVYEVGVESSTVTDFLGLFRMKFKGGGPVKVTVYPKVLEDFSLPLSQQQISEGSHGVDRFSDNYADVTDVRKHDPTDDYRRIHWKLTAKRGEFIVKNYKAPGLSKTAVFLDTAACRGDSAAEIAALEDLLASLAVSTLDICLKNRQMAQLVYGVTARESITVEKHEDMERSFELLAMLPFEAARGALGKSINTALLDREQFDDMIIFASSIDRGLCDIVKAGFSAGHAAVFYYVCPGEFSPAGAEFALLEELSAHGVETEVLR